MESCKLESRQFPFLSNVPSSASSGHLNFWLSPELPCPCRCSDTSRPRSRVFYGWLESPSAKGFISNGCGEAQTFLAISTGGLTTVFRRSDLSIPKPCEVYCLAASHHEPGKTIVQNFETSLGVNAGLTALCRLTADNDP